MTTGIPFELQITPERYYRGMGITYCGPAPTDSWRLSQPMGQFQFWCGKLFYWSGEFLGWRYINQKEVPDGAH
jgi:hypothetical protein